MENKVNRFSCLSRQLIGKDQRNGGAHTLAGGKLTDYRKMAEGAMKNDSNHLSRKEYQKEFTLIDSKTIQFQAGN